MASFLYVRPDESFMFGSCSGTVQSTYDANWLVNGQPSYPVRGATGLALTVTALSARTVSLVAVCHHNLTGSIAISGGVTATVPAATFGKDGIPRNTWVAVTPVSASSLVMTVSQTPSIVGELIAGTKRTLQRQLQTEPVFDPGEPYEWEGDGGLMAPYDPGLAGRVLRGETIVNGNGLAEIEAWYESTRRGTRPTLIVPNDAVNDAWLVSFQYQQVPTLVHADPHRSLITVQFVFTEVPRVRWPA